MKKYEQPQLDMTIFEVCDIITNSVNNWNNTVTNGDEVIGDETIGDGESIFSDLYMGAK